MTAETETSPPYTTYKTYKSFIEQMKQDGLPSQIDRSLLPRMSGSGQSALISTLKALNLIDENGVTSAELHMIVEKEEDEAAEALDSVARKTYSFLFSSGVNLKRATAKQVEELFRSQGIGGSTVDRAIHFYVALADDLGWSVSPHVKNRKPSASPKKLKMRRPKAVSEASSTEKPSTAASDTNHSSIKEKLVDKFPEFNPEWSAEVQAKWFEGFSRLMDTAND